MDNSAINKEPKPTVGRMVHYKSYGSPNGEYVPECRDAVITDISTWGNQGQNFISLCVLNPEGMYFNKRVGQMEPTEGQEPKGGTWHWPERV